MMNVSSKTRVSNTYDVFCAIGNQGVGKSTLLNSLFGCKFEANPNPNQVTTQQQEDRVFDKILSKDIIVIDACGYDGNSNNFLDLDRYQGRTICMIFLNNDFRINSSLEKIKKKYQINGDDINYYNSVSFVPPQPIADFDVPHYNQIRVDYEKRCFKTFKYEPQLKKNIRSPLEKSLSSDATWKFTFISKPMFTPFPEFSQCKYEKSYFQQYFKSIYAENAAESVRLTRRLGDCLIKYFCLKYSLETGETMISNVKMKSFLLEKLGIKNQKIYSLYQINNNTTLSDEKYADVFESMFYYVFQKRKQFLSLLDMYISHCQDGK